MLQNENYESRIIFPDYKSNLDLNIGNKDYTIRNMIDDSRKKLEKEFILSIAFLDEEGNLIANSVQASMLARLSMFQININGGERIYNCVNPSYLGNNQYERGVMGVSKDSDLDELERLVFQENMSFRSAMKVLKISKNYRYNINYSSIFKDYLNSKYSVLNEFYESKALMRERRIQKFLNFFFYVCLTQTVGLNLCTFVFFNWDFMEPITQCITYLNIISGYYYWAWTDSDYEIESMISWLRSRQFITASSDSKQLFKEREEIRRLLEENYSKI